MSHYLFADGRSCLDVDGCRLIRVVAAKGCVHMGQGINFLRVNLVILIDSSSYK